MKIIMIGFGVVGQSIAEILTLRSVELKEEYGINPKVVAIVDRRGAATSKEGIDLRKALETKKSMGSISALQGIGKLGYTALDVLEGVDGDLVIEVTPTNVETGEPGLTHIKTALSLGRHIVTTNKGPLALALPNLLELSRKNDACLRFSGAVGGGIPVLAFAKRCLLGEKIIAIRGVLNGTTNYVLWKMAEEHVDLERALEEARKLGYAEANVSYDLDGIDAACKLVILANWVMNFKARLSDVEIQGINGITLQEIMDADRENSAVRLVGSIDNGITVSPRRISKRDPLCVNAAYNAIQFTTAYSGQHILIGKGAGGQETAVSVIRDILDIQQTIEQTNPLTQKVVGKYADTPLSVYSK